MTKISLGHWVTGLALLMTIALTSCSDTADSAGSEGEDATAELRKIEQEVLDIHDEVMPKMGDLNNNRKKLIKRLYTRDSVEYGMRIRESVDNLEEADSLMWDWMHNYSRPSYDKDLDSVEAYLNAELVKVKVMREKFFSGLSESEALLKELNLKDE